MILGVVPAAGRGERLMPLTRDTPKPLLPAAGRPWVAWVLDELLEVADHVVVACEHPASFAATLGPVEGVTYVHAGLRHWPGPAGALVAALESPMTRHLRPDRVLTVMGDTIIPTGTLRQLTRCPAEAAVAVTCVPDPENHLPIEIGSGWVVNAIGASTDKPMWVDAGAHMLTSRAMEDLWRCWWDGLGVQEIKFRQVLERVLCRGGRVEAVPVPGPWRQIGDHEGVDGYRWQCEMLEARVCATT